MSSLTRRFEHGPVPPVRMLQGGGHVARVRPWPGDTTTAQLVTLDLQVPPPIAVLRSWITQIRDDGYLQVRTGAVSSLRTAPYDALSFAVAQHLALLHLDLRLVRAPLPVPERAPLLRTAHRDEHLALADVDAAAFPSGWALDAAAIAEATEATPRARVRTALDDHGRPVGYSVGGRAGRTAFLQRLAVLPEAQGHGVGATLVDDVIRWAGRWRCRSVAVNTQVDNDPALRLYERAGFVARSHGLVVMERSLRSEP